MVLLHDPNLPALASEVGTWLGRLNHEATHAIAAAVASIWMGRRGWVRLIQGTMARWGL
jgi:hypothetical protein